jgi:four helix bundle protein
MLPDLHSADQGAWERGCPRSITLDPIWKLDAYRSALFLLHLVWSDTRPNSAPDRYAHVQTQLLDAAGSISAHIGEGYSRATRPDRLKFFGYGLGSTRESVTWYLALRGVLTDEVIEHRLAVISATRGQPLGLIRSTRAKSNSPRVFEK